MAGEAYALRTGEAEKALSELPSGCINTCLTSPPYWRTRDYKHPSQLGLEDDVEDYVARLVRIFAQVRRTLRDDGTVWLNLGDCYFNSAQTVDGKPPTRGWQRNKQLALIPFRLAIALEDDGWWIRNVAVWHKPNAMPSSVKDRLTNTWEPVFLLAKAEDYYFDLDAVRLPHSTDDSVERKRAMRGCGNGKARGQAELRRWLTSPRHRVTIEGLKEVRRRPNVPLATELAAYLRLALENRKVSIDWVAEQLGLPFERTRHYFRTDEIGARLPPEDVWLKLKTILDLGTEFDSRMMVEIGDNAFRNHPKGRNPGDFLSQSLAGKASESHFAMMPQALAEWALKASLPSGGICLDPFMGMGTTGHASLKLGGKFVGVDVRADYVARFASQLLEHAPLFLFNERRPGGEGLEPIAL